jgi:predicted membrane protein
MASPEFEKEERRAYTTLVGAGVIFFLLGILIFGFAHFAIPSLKLNTSTNTFFAALESLSSICFNLTTEVIGAWFIYLLLHRILLLNRKEGGTSSAETTLSKEHSLEVIAQGNDKELKIRIKSALEYLIANRKIDDKDIEIFWRSQLLDETDMSSLNEQYWSSQDLPPTSRSK